MPLPRGQEGDPDEFFGRVKGNGYNDLCELPRLSKDAILSNLKKRFKSEVVYTYVGDIIVSVNPFCNTGCVGKSIRKKYKGNKNPALLPPHIYALVDSTYSSLIEGWQSQSVLISGESGAGKTEAMKICLTYLGELSVSAGGKGKEPTGGASESVASRLMSTNPIMEGLGNAKTVRNNNSSRFGKHFDVQFGSQGEILGAFTSTYLLEKPRIAQHMDGERNYHVFYMVCKAPEDVRSPIGLSKWQDYAILNQKGTVAEVTTWDDKAEFKDMHSALLQLGFTETTRSECYKMLATALALGNVTFAAGKGGDSSVDNPDVLAACAKMLEVEDADLAAAITLRTMGGGAIESYKKPLEKAQAITARNSCVMHIYSLVFDWCTDMINAAIAVRDAEACIGILDIFGFENFTLNSFPQLCINLTNEQLHNLFIEHVFKLEQQTYVNEDVDWNFVDYEDNQHVLDLITKRPVCILGLLDEACVNAASTDASFIQNMHQEFPKKYKAYIKPKLAFDKNFGVSHYAGDVTYSVEGFVEKNKDALSVDITELLELKTKWEQLKELAVADRQKKEDADAAKASKKKSKGGGGKKKKTVGRSFGESLTALKNKLQATEKHYIRCLKPNQTLKAGDWDGDFMFKQLAYSGTMEVTEIRKAGLNVRRPLKQFYMYYKICADDQKVLQSGETLRDRTKLLMMQLPLDMAKYRVGKTIMFLQTPDMLDTLDAIREVKALEYIINLQSMLRMLRELRKYRKVRRCIFRIQGAAKTVQVRRAFREVSLASNYIGKFARSYIAHARLKQMLAMEKRPKKERIVRMLEHTLYPRRVGFHGNADGDDDENADQKRNVRPVFVARGQALFDVLLHGRTEPTRCWAALRQGAFTLFEARNQSRVAAHFDLANYTIEKRPKGGTERIAIVRKKGNVDLASGPPPAAKSKAAPDENEGTSTAVVLSRGNSYDDEPVPGRRGCLCIGFGSSKKRRAARRARAKKGEAAKPEGEDAQSTEAVEEAISAKDAHGLLTYLAPDKSGLVPSPQEITKDTKKWLELLRTASDEATEADKIRINFLRDEYLQVGMPAPESASPVVLEGEMWVNVRHGRGRTGFKHRYLTLRDNGEITVYDSEALAEASLTVHLRYCALEVTLPSDDTDKDAMHGGDTILGGEHVLQLVEGRHLCLQTGDHTLYLATPEQPVFDDWLATLRLGLGAFVQDSPIFAQKFIEVTLPDKRVIDCPMSFTTRSQDLKDRLCASQDIANSSEWALYEVWSHNGIPPGVCRRLVPDTEQILDQTVLRWEIAVRSRYGLLAQPPRGAFRLELLRTSSLAPASCSKLEWLLEFKQAMTHVREGMVIDAADVIDLIALALHVENNFDATVPDKASLKRRLDSKNNRFIEVARKSEAASKSNAWTNARSKLMKSALVQDEMRLSRMRGIQKNRSRVNLMDQSRSFAFDTRSRQVLTARGQATVRLKALLPLDWLAPKGRTETEIIELVDEWDGQVVGAQRELLGIHVVEDPSGLTPLRAKVYNQSLEAMELSSLAAMRVVVDYMRGVPGCFGCDLNVAVWLPPDDSAAKQIGTEHPMVLTIGKTKTELRLLPRGAHEKFGPLMGSFNTEDEIISWTSLEGMLVINVVGPDLGHNADTRARMKLHLLCLESRVASRLFSRYAGEKLRLLQEQLRVDTIKRKQLAEEAKKRAGIKPLGSQRTQRMDRAKAKGRGDLMDDHFATNRSIASSREVRKTMIERPGKESARSNTTSSNGDSTPTVSDDSMNPMRVMRSLSQKFFAPEAIDEELDREAKLREIFTATDFNTDGSISVEEFKALAASQSSMALSMQETVFGMVDANSDGALSIDEFVKFNLETGAAMDDATFLEQAEAWLSLAKTRVNAALPPSLPVPLHRIDASIPLPPPPAPVPLDAVAIHALPPPPPPVPLDAVAIHALPPPPPPVPLDAVAIHALPPPPPGAKAAVVVAAAPSEAPVDQLGEAVDHLVPNEATPAPPTKRPISKRAPSMKAVFGRKSERNLVAAPSTRAPKSERNLLASTRTGGKSERNLLASTRTGGKSERNLLASTEGKTARFAPEDQLVDV